MVARNALDIFVSGFQVRVFPNASLGLDLQDESYGHQCSPTGLPRPQNAIPSRNQRRDDRIMDYTPNRRTQASTIMDATRDRLQLAFVLALGGHSNQYYDYGPAGSLNGVMAVWDSWVEMFFSRVSNSTSIILLFDERDFRRQNVTRSKEEYMDLIVMGNMNAEPVDCVHMRDGGGMGTKVETDISDGGNIPGSHPRRGGGGHSHSHLHSHRRKGHNSPRNFLGNRHPPHGCDNFLRLDSGYRVYYIDVAQSSNVSDPNQLPFLIFASVHNFPVPEWAKDKDEEHLFIHWRPWRMGRFKTNYGYVKMTNWYAYHLLNLKLLDFFDYGGKLDNDVSFVSPFPETNLPRKLASRETKMLVSQNGWYFDEPRVAQGIKQCLSKFIEQESRRCDGGAGTISLIPGGQNATLFWESNFNATFRAHFLVYWLGLYTAPETKVLARFWNDWHPHGMWDYRWGDQQWWPRPMSMFGSGNLTAEIDHFDEINTDNERYVVHKAWPRYGTISASNAYFNFSGSTKVTRREIYMRAAKEVCKGARYLCVP